MSPDTASSTPPPGRPRSGLIAVGLIALVLFAALAAYLVLEGDPDSGDEGGTGAAGDAGGPGGSRDDRLVGITDDGVVLFDDEGVAAQTVDVGAAADDIRPLLLHGGWLVALVGDDEIVAVRASDGTLQRFEVATFEDDWGVVAVRADEPTVALGSPSGVRHVVVLDLADGTSTEIDGGDDALLLPEAVQASPDGSTFAVSNLRSTSGDSPTIIVRAGGDEVARVDGYLVGMAADTVVTGAVEPGDDGDGTTLLRIHDLDGEEVERFEVDAERRPVGLPDGRLLLVPTDGGGPLQVAEADGDVDVVDATAPEGEPSTIAITPDGERIVIVSGEEFALYDADLTEVARHPTPEGPLSARVLDGDCVPFGLDPGPLTVIDLTTGDVEVDGEEAVATSHDRCSLLLLDGTQLTSTRTGDTATVDEDIRIQRASADGERYLVVDIEDSTTSLATMAGGEPVELGRGWFAFVPLG